jgi:hypothetical protein
VNYPGVGPSSSRGEEQGGGEAAARGSRICVYLQISAKDGREIHVIFVPNFNKNDFFFGRFVI